MASLDDNDVDSGLYCAVCKGTRMLEVFWIKVEGGKPIMDHCPFCRGTGRANKWASAVMKFHICQCYHYDRKHCWLCREICHHEPHDKVKVLIR